MNLLEYDLRPHRGSLCDLHNLVQGRAVVLLRTRDVLRVVRWCALVTPDGVKTPTGFVVAEFLRSRDPMWDDDIHLQGVRYATRSGVTIRQYIPDPGPLQRAAALESILQSFLKVPRNQDRPQVRRLVQNRIRKYLR